MGYVPVFAMKQQIIPNFWSIDIYRGGNYGIQNQGVIYAASHGRGFFKLEDFRAPAANKPIEYVNNVPKLNVYPNPTHGVLNVNIVSDTYKNETVNILSLDGRIVKSESIRLNKGNNTYRTDVSTLSNGVYIITVGKEKAKFIKK